MRAFYSRVTYGIGGPFISTVREIKIRLDPKSICRIFNIAPVGLKVTRVLPYGRFLTRVFKDVGVDLGRETDFKAPNAYDTYDEQSMGWLKFEKVPDGSWVRRAERPLTQARGQGQTHLGVEEEVEIREMEGGVDSQSGYR
ncbi:hypothetical protein VitviT2T_023306 [Vitis vinifera]|uniref:Uncharacterized protein n=1 Tax=Vitis vinifera TaxID=29760 RepID=A0ABY9DCK9_VITVI|nr:hypothetical protein VitviT2T_023306 [Vitis vinifera]